jgi:phosphopantothenoylcysteine decarboxylase/phosphopantothenate--cysteine ligase
MNLKKSLKNKNILITAGPTREYLDPVRYISNDSSGKMGYALAAVAKKMGAKVTLISGPTNLKGPQGVALVSVTSAKEMHRATLAEFKKMDITICAAAVADFRPQSRSRQKIKKDEIKAIGLIKNPDILKSIGRKKKKKQILVGFALETQDLKKNALKKLKDKNCDFIVANSPKNISSAQATVTIISKDKTEHSISKNTKAVLAKKLLEIIAS